MPKTTSSVSQHHKRIRKNKGTSLEKLSSYVKAIWRIVAFSSKKSEGGGGDASEVYAWLLKHELFGFDFASSPVGYGSPRNLGIMWFKTEHQLPALPSPLPNLESLSFYFSIYMFVHIFYLNSTFVISRIMKIGYKLDSEH